MSEETNNSDEVDFEELLRNKLKNADVRTMEQTIAKAIGELIGTKLKCSIESMEFPTAPPITNAKVKLSLYEPSDFHFGSREKPSS